jgi:hypothetical protein
LSGGTLTIGNDSIDSYVQNIIDTYMSNYTVDWNDITNKPSRYPAESHDHTGTGHSHSIPSGGSTGTTYLTLSGP